MPKYSVFRVDNSTSNGDHMGDYEAPTAEAAEQHAEAECGKPWARMVAIECPEEDWCE
jgi:hypothetical protein